MQGLHFFFMPMYHSIDSWFEMDRNRITFTTLLIQLIQTNFKHFHSSSWWYVKITEVSGIRTNEVKMAVQRHFHFETVLERSWKLRLLQLLAEMQSLVATWEHLAPNKGNRGRDRMRRDTHPSWWPGTQCTDLSSCPCCLGPARKQEKPFSVFFSYELMYYLAIAITMLSIKCVPTVKSAQRRSTFSGFFGPPFLLSLTINFSLEE